MKVETTSDPAILKTALDFLNGHRKMVLTVLGEDSAPASSLMLFATDDHFNIYFGTCRCFGKYKAVTAHNKVSLAVVQEEVDPLQVLDIMGEAEEIPESETADRLAWFTEKNPAKYYVKDAEDFVMFKIKPSRVRWLDATSGELKIYTLATN